MLCPGDVADCELVRITDQAMKNTLMTTKQSDMTVAVSLCTSHAKSLLVLYLTMVILQRLIAGFNIDCKGWRTDMSGVALRRALM